MDSIVDELMELAPDTMSVRAPLTRDAKGKVLTWGPAFSVPCRLEGLHSKGMQQSGQEKVPGVTAYCMGVFGLTTFHEFTLPAEYNPRMPKAKSVDLNKDENLGGHHEVVTFV